MPTGDRLIGALAGVVRVRGTRHLPHLAESRGPRSSETRAAKRAMKTCATGVLLGPPGGAARPLDAQALPEAHERTLKIPPAGAPHEARITIKTNQIRQAVLPQRLHHRRKHRLRRVIFAGLDAERDGGTHINNVKRLHHVELLPVRIWRHTVRILEIELPGDQRVRALHGHMDAARTVADAAMQGEDLPDGAGRARQEQPVCQECLIAVQVVQDRFGTGRAL